MQVTKGRVFAIGRVVYGLEVGGFAVGGFDVCDTMHRFFDCDLQLYIRKMVNTNAYGGWDTKH